MAKKKTTKVLIDWKDILRNVYLEKGLNIPSSEFESVPPVDNYRNVSHKYLAEQFIKNKYKDQHAENTRKAMQILSFLNDRLEIEQKDRDHAWSVTSEIGFYDFIQDKFGCNYAAVSKLMKRLKASDVLESSGAGKSVKIRWGGTPNKLKAIKGFLVSLETVSIRFSEAEKTNISRLFKEGKTVNQIVYSLKAGRMGSWDGMSNRRIDARVTTYLESIKIDLPLELPLGVEPIAAAEPTPAAEPAPAAEPIAAAEPTPAPLLEAAPQITKFEKAYDIQRKLISTLITANNELLSIIGGDLD